MSSGATTTKRQGNREKLLDAAVRLIEQQGYGRITARDLVAASDTNLNSIGYHYGSKEALLNEAIAIGVRGWIAEMAEAAFSEDAGVGRGQLEASLAAIIERFAERRNLAVSFVEAFPQAVRSPELGGRMAAMFDETLASGAEIFRRGFEQEGLDLDPGHARTLSTLVAAICDGLLLIWLIDPGQLPSARQIMEALAVIAPPPSPTTAR